MAKGLWCAAYQNIYGYGASESGTKIPNNLEIDTKIGYKLDNWHNGIKWFLTGDGDDEAIIYEYV